jgi:hypothetical protein
MDESDRIAFEAHAGGLLAELGYPVGPDARATQPAATGAS